jgi:hypothetical protein
MAIDAYKQHGLGTKEAHKIEQMKKIMDRATLFNLSFLQNPQLVERLCFEMDEKKEDETLLKELIVVFEAFRETEKKACMS